MTQEEQCRKKLGKKSTIELRSMICSKIHKVENIENLRLFHNFVKRSLLRTAVFEIRKSNPSKELSLLDVAVGRGGDIFKWNELNINNVVGFDIEKESLTEAQRRIDQPQRQVLKTKISLFKGSATDIDSGEKALNLLEAMKEKTGTKPVPKPKIKKISKEEILNFKKTQLKQYREIYMDKLGIKTIPSDHLLINIWIQEQSEPVTIPKQTNICFDIISCQFALHYFFKDRESLYNFFKICKNVGCPGCILIITTVDGGKVYDLLKNRNNYESKVLKLEKKYDVKKNYPSTTTVFENPYGNSYSYYLEDKSIKKSYFQRETGQDVSNEFLVDNKELIRIALMNDFEIVKSPTIYLDSEHSVWLQGNNQSFSWWYSHYDKQARFPLSKEAKEASFLNESFIFQKKY